MLYEIVYGWCYGRSDGRLNLVEELHISDSKYVVIIKISSMWVVRMSTCHTL